MDHFRLGTTGIATLSVNDLSFDLFIRDKRSSTEGEFDFRKYSLGNGQLTMSLLIRKPKRQEENRTVQLDMIDPKMQRQFTGKLNAQAFQIAFENLYSQLMSQLPFLAIEFFEAKLRELAVGKEKRKNPSRKRRR